LQRGLARLLFENFQAAQQRHAGAQQIGHLREEAATTRVETRPPRQATAAVCLAASMRTGKQAAPNRAW